MTYYFNKIEICEAYHLNRVQFSAITRTAFFDEYMPFEQLSNIGLISCEIKETTEHGVKVFDIQVSAKTNDTLQLSEKAYVIRLTDICGHQFLMGTAIKPHPAITLTDRYGKAGDGVGTTFTARLKSTLPLLRLIQVM